MKTVNLDKKFAAAIVALILISTAIGALLVQQYFPQIGSIKAEGMEDPLEAWSEASYIIWQYNTTFYASRNMSTWDTELDSNASKVFNFAIWNTTTGMVFVKYGNYSIDEAIQLKSHVDLISDGALLRLADGQAVAENKTCIINTSSDVVDVEIAGFNIDGNAANNLGATASHCGNNLYIGRSSAVDIDIHHCNIYNARRIGIEVRATGNKKTYNVNIHHCNITYSGYNDVEFQSYDSTSEIYGCSVSHCFTGTGTGDISYNTYQVTPSTPPTVHDITISYNTIGNMTGSLGSSNPAAWMGIKFEDSYRCRAEYNTMFGCSNAGIADDAQSKGQHRIVGNTIYLKPVNTSAVSNVIYCKGITLFSGNNTVSQNRIYATAGTYTCYAYGLRIESGCDNSTFVENYFENLGSSNNTYGIRDSAGKYNLYAFNNLRSCTTAMNLAGATSPIVFKNVGFVTENTVLNAANTTATTFVFNHALASTANSVQVSFNFTGWTSWTWTSTTTQVTVTITGTLPAAMSILAADVKYIP